MEKNKKPEYLDQQEQSECICFRKQSPNARDTAELQLSMFLLRESSMNEKQDISTLKAMNHLDTNDMDNTSIQDSPAHMTNPPASSVLCRSSVLSGL